MADAPCPHGEPHPAACLSCIEEGPPRAKPSSWHRAGHTFPAAYSGTCPAVRCGEAFEVGDRIRQWSFGPSYGSPEATAYTHADCGAPAG